MFFGGVKMETQNTENAYIIDDVNSFCSSVQILDPSPDNQTVSIDELENNYSDSMVEKAKQKKHSSST